MKKHEPKYIEVEGIMRACYDSFLKTGNKTYSEIIALADAVPAADVAEVVRCKDCKYQNKGQNECESWNMCEYRSWLYFPVNDDDYCSKGERWNE